MPLASYRLCGVTLEAAVPFPELMATNAMDPVCAFRLADRPLADPPASASFLCTQLGDGQPWLSCARCDGGYLLRFNNLATFLVSPQGNQIECCPAPGVPAHTVRHLFLDTVFPLILNLRGHHALHATAVAGPRRCCAFLGGAGLGKSSLAAAFLARGWALVCDDCLRLEAGGDEMFAVASYPGIRLWPDATAALLDDGDRFPAVAHYTGKSRVALSSGATDPVPLRCLYTLGTPDDAAGARIRIETQSSRSAFFELLQHTFRLDIADAAMLSRQFRFLQRVVSCIPVRRLVYPRDFVSLPAVVEAITHNLEDERARCD